MWCLSVLMAKTAEWDREKEAWRAAVVQELAVRLHNRVERQARSVVRKRNIEAYWAERPPLAGPPLRFIRCRHDAWDDETLQDLGCDECDEYFLSDVRRPPYPLPYWSPAAVLLRERQGRGLC
jgi:hypothetical protein